MGERCADGQRASTAQVAPSSLRPAHHTQHATKLNNRENAMIGGVGSTQGYRVDSCVAYTDTLRLGGSSRMQVWSCWWIRREGGRRTQE